MWSPEDDVLLEAATYYKNNKINNKIAETPPEFQLSKEDSYYEKCGRIFATRKRLLVFHCSFCKKKYGTLFHFLQHISAKHLNEWKEPAVTAEETDHSKAYDTKETISVSADLWPQHESVFFELENENDHIDQTILEPTVKKETIFEDTLKPLNRMKTRSKITPIHLSKRNAPEPLTKENMSKEIPELLIKLGKTIGQRIDSSQSESETKSKSNDLKSKEKEKSEPSKKRFKSCQLTKKSRKPSHFKCDICDKVFSREDNYKLHLMSHSDFKAYKCKICGNNIKYKNNINKHMLRHTNERNFQCDLCDKSFFTRTEVKVHRRIHTGERPYVCSICGDTFKTTGSLSGHTRRHKNLYIRKCDVCGKGFISRCELREHMIKHTGERPYDCSYCSNKFGCRRTLLQHIKLHINAHEYECKFCDKAFNQKSALISHTKNNHRKYENIT